MDRHTGKRLWRMSRPRRDSQHHDRRGPRPRVLRGKHQPGTREVADGHQTDALLGHGSNLVARRAGGSVVGCRPAWNSPTHRLLSYAHEIVLVSGSKT